MSFGLIILTIIWFLLILSFLVLIHEFGHFLAAKAVGVFVEEFGLGYPPRVKKLFRWRGTLFSLNALPFGGFVRLHGDEAETLEGKSGSTSQPSVPEDTEFASKSIPKRLFIILAGVFVNFVFGSLAFALIYSRIGIPTPTGIIEIIEVQPDSPAATAGLQVYDTITGVQAGEASLQPTRSNDFISFVTQHKGEEVSVSIRRNDTEGTPVEETLPVYVRTDEEKTEGDGSMGIGLSDTDLRFYPGWQMPFRGIWVGLQEAVSMGWLIVTTLRDMAVDLFTRGVVPKDVAGPVGIIDQAFEVQAVKQGFLANLNTAALLSINLAIMNLLPIPALDGGRALFIVVEPLIGKERRRRWEGKANAIGFTLLIGLIVLITLNDILRIVF